MRASIVDSWSDLIGQVYYSRRSQAAWGLFGRQYGLPPIQRCGAIGRVVYITIDPCAVPFARHSGIEEFLNGVKTTADVDGIHKHTLVVDIQLAAQLLQGWCQLLGNGTDVFAAEHADAQIAAALHQRDLFSLGFAFETVTSSQPFYECRSTDLLPVA